MQPALRILEQAGGELEFQDLLDLIAETLSLGPADSSRRLSNGRETALSNDLRWALSYLSIEGKLRLSADGKRVHSSGSAGLREAAAPYVPFEGTPAASTPSAEETDSDEDGSDLARLFRQANRRLKRDLLGHVHAREPAFFEQMILDLLVAIGYAPSSGQHKARRLGGRSDGGVDGVIYQDELGLDFFYFQAKRYKPSTTVPISEVRDFCGSLEAHKAPKGVFVTTAFLPKTAHSFVAAIPRRITLIDGDGLADLMIRHNVGVKPEPLYQLKEFDPGYFRL
ncbi:MAG: restriction endonuclease [Anderseniella sp.]|jgi:restriction system protein|nr:restriction endonuclease [Anderseniella sp.]